MYDQKIFLNSETKMKKYFYYNFFLMIINIKKNVIIHFFSETYAKKSYHLLFFRVGGLQIVN